ncbi:MAG: glycosyltransferase [Patescibacteria group bacterium]
MTTSTLTTETSNRKLYNSIIIILTCIVIVGIIVVKSRNFNDFSGDYFLISYALLVTLFQTSRVVSALLYKYSNKGLLAPPSDWNANDTYEPIVTFVVPCKNEEGAIRNTVTKCLDANYPKDKIEVIVINDGSTDRTGEILDEMKKELPERLTIIHWKKNRGKRHGMAEGFARARGEIIVQLDSDSYIMPDNFKKLIEPFRNESIGAVCAHADPDNSDENMLTRMQAAYYFVSFRIMKAAESTYGLVFCCSGCCSAYRKTAVMPIMEQWLNEQFLGALVTWGDDRSLTSWVIRQGYKTIYTDQAKSVTIVPSTLRQFIVQQVRWKKSWIINAFFTGRFIIKKEPFIALLYYYPLILISILTPFMAARALVYMPFTIGVASTLYYLLGIALVTSLFILVYRAIAPENKYWPYMYAWSGFSTFFLTFLIFYAAATLQNRGWGTR